MSRWVNSRAVGWTSAGVVLAAGGLFAVLFASGSASGPGNLPGPSGGYASKDAMSPRGQKAVLVRVVRPQREHLKRETTQAAHVEAYEKVDVLAKATGYVHQFAQVSGPDGKMRDLDIGDRVAKNQVLVELWIPEMVEELNQKKDLVAQAEAELEQSKAAFEATKAVVAAARAQIDLARADLGRLNADLAYRKGEYDRYQKLLTQRTTSAELVEEKLNQYRAAYAALETGQKAVSKAEADLGVEQARQLKARADVTSAEARLRVSRANLKQTELLVGYARVRAPFDGVVTRRLVDTGTFVRSAALGEPKPLFTLARTDRLRVVTEIPENDSPWVKVGQPAVLHLNAARGHRFTGRVARLADALDRTSHTMTVEVELDDRDRQLRPGLYGEVTITLADYPKALMLPTSALVPTGSKPTVMLVKDGVARPCEVTLGINDGIQMQITAGLKGNEQVITDGKDGVRDGMSVTIAGK